MPLLHRRRVVCGLAALPFGCSLFGGGKTNADRNSSAPATPTGPAYPVAWEAASLGHNADEVLLNQWTQAMWVVKYDSVPFLRSFRDAKASKKPNLAMFYAEQPGFEIGAHTWTIADKHGRPSAEIGEAAIARVVASTGLLADDMRIAGYGLATVPVQIDYLNIHSQHLRREVDKLLYDHEVRWPQMVQGGQVSQEEYEKRKPDVEMALRIRARYYASIQQAHAEVVMITVLAMQFMQPGAIEELEAIADEVIEAGKEVRPFPRPEAFGLGASTSATFEQAAIGFAWSRAFPVVFEYAGGLKSKVPLATGTPQGGAPGAGGSVEAQLEAAGIRVGGDFLAALPDAKALVEDYRSTKAILDTAVGGAQSAMSGDVGGTLEAAGKLIPGDPLVGASLDTIAAATRGDVRGVLAGLDRVTKDSKIRARVRKRLARFEKLRPIVEAGVEVAKRVR